MVHDGPHGHAGHISEPLLLPSCFAQFKHFTSIVESLDEQLKRENKLNIINANNANANATMEKEKADADADADEEKRATNASARNRKSVKYEQDSDSDLDLHSKESSSGDESYSSSHAGDDSSDCCSSSSDEGEFTKVATCNVKRKKPKGKKHSKKQSCTTRSSCAGRDSSEDEVITKDTARKRTKGQLGARSIQSSPVDNLDCLVETHPRMKCIQKTLREEGRLGPRFQNNLDCLMETHPRTK